MFVVRVQWLLGLNSNNFQVYVNEKSSRESFQNFINKCQIAVYHNIINCIWWGFVFLITSHTEQARYLKTMLELDIKVIFYVRCMALTSFGPLL
jgi:hypothetical protein